MLAPYKQVLSEYKYFMIKMFNDFVTNPIVATNYMNSCVKWKQWWVDLCVTNIGNNTKLKQTCSKYKIFHLSLCYNSEAHSR
jgi:SET domain-containing protein